MAGEAVRSAEGVSIHGRDAILAGEIWYPCGALLAGVVMIGGSGASDRSNGGYFLPHRDHFANHGIAALWYDKRGVGESTGNWQAGSLDDLAADAAAGAASLRRNLGDAAPVGLFGHSEGGWVGLRAAARFVEPAFVITNSCPATSPARQDRYAVTAAMAADRLPDADRAAALRLYDDLADAASRGLGYAEVRRIYASSPASRILCRYASSFDQPMWGFWKRIRDHDPIPDCLALRCPHLAIYGSADPLLPVEESVAALTAAACNPSRHPAATTTIHLLPRANHRLLTGKGATPSRRFLVNLSKWITATHR